ncbi:MAG TPA: basic secretory protein-like protein [Gemmataceae bacterium]|jgi:hypothetical protein|nr:basic secretory protein-like protein [Gemmataceae bacterium]
MRHPLLVCLLLAGSVPLGTPNRATAVDKGATKDKPWPAALKVTVDTTEVPERADWAKKAKKLVEKWHPIISDLLKSDGFTPPGDVKLVFKKDMEGVAYTSRTTIVIAADWIKEHPDDYGMVVHELTHVIQNYRHPGPSWLIEGIADYVRFYHYEPKTKLTIERRRPSYRDGYRTTAMFLAWIEKSHDKNIVRKLNESLRKAKYKDELFQTYTSKTVDELWKSFVASRHAK